MEDYRERDYECSCGNCGHGDAGWEGDYFCELRPGEYVDGVTGICEDWKEDKDA